MASSAPPPPTPDSQGNIVNGTVGFGFGGWSWLAVGIFLLGIILALSGRPLLNKYKQYHSRIVAEKVMQAIDEERWEAASALLTPEISNNRDDPHLLRAMGEFCMKAYGDAQMASTALRRLIAGGQATDDDARRCAEVLILAGDLIESRRIYDALPQATRDSRLGLELLAQITHEQGQPGEAMRILRRALNSEPDNPDCQLRLAILNENSSMEDSKKQAAVAIWKIAQRNDRTGLTAINHLASDSVLTATEVVELRKLVEAHPLTADRDRYHVLHAYLKHRPLERRALINAEMQRNKGRSPESLFDFLRWLGLEKEAPAILSIVPKEIAIRDADIFLVYVDALSAAEHWAELRDIMLREKVQVSKATANYVLAQCYARLEPDLYKARQYILSTYGNANSRAEIDIIFRAATLAESVGIIDLARQGYQKAADAKPRNQLLIVEKLHELAAREKDIPSMFSTLQRLRELRPGNQSYTDRLNYLRLITGQDMEEAWQAILGLGDVPASNLTSSAVPPALLHALANYRLGVKESSIDQLKDLSLRPSELPAGQRAVLAGMMRLAGEDITAFRIAENIPQTLLLDEERYFAARVLN